jgi:hypothetical protein
MVEAMKKAPRWATDAGTTVEPILSEKEAGWEEDFQPPARWMNWFMNAAYTILDSAYRSLSRDWRRSSEDIIPSGRISSPSTRDAGIGYHNGLYYTQINDVGGDVQMASPDGRRWFEFGTEAGVGTATAPFSYASDGSRLVAGRDTTTGLARYSDDDGATWNDCSVLTGAEMMITYLPNADLWLAGESGGNTFKSSDGATWSAVAGVSFSQNMHQFAEDADGTVIVFGDQYSDDSGATWQAMTIPGAVTGYDVVWSDVVGNFVFAGRTVSDTKIYLMSSTDGTWETVAEGTITANDVDAFMEVRGVLVAVADNAVMYFSDDGGVTWDVGIGVGRGDGGTPLLKYCADSEGNQHVGSHAVLRIGFASSTDYPEEVFTIAPAFNGSPTTALL